MGLFRVIVLVLSFFCLRLSPVWAVEASTEVSSFTSNTLSMIVAIAGVAEVFFLIKGGYEYMASSGKPEKLVSAKRTIRNAVIGLVIVLGSVLLVSLFNKALTGEIDQTQTSSSEISDLTIIDAKDGLSQVLIDAVSAFMQNILETATKPVVDGVLGYLTTTPSLMENKTVVNFWLMSLGIADSLFVIVVALLGLKVMSGDAFGFGEVELKQVIPRIGFFFLLANVSLFLADYVLKTGNVLVKAVLDSTGGLSHSWVVNSINPENLVKGASTVPLITLIFLMIFLMVAILLLFMFITRLIVIALMAVLSPLIFMLWTSPKFSDLAEMAAKSYFVAVFMVFVQVVIIQLAAAFLTLPEQSNSSLISIAVAIGLFFTLLKVPKSLNQMIFYVSGSNGFKKIGNQIINVVSADDSKSLTRSEVLAQVKRLKVKK